MKVYEQGDIPRENLELKLKKNLHDFTEEVMSSFWEKPSGTFWADLSPESVAQWVNAV